LQCAGLVSDFLLLVLLYRYNWVENEFLLHPIPKIQKPRNGPSFCFNRIYSRIFRNNFSVKCHCSPGSHCFVHSKLLKLYIVHYNQMWQNSRGFIAIGLSKNSTLPSNDKRVAGTSFARYVQRFWVSANYSNALGHEDGRVWGAFGDGARVFTWYSRKDINNKEFRQLLTCFTCLMFANVFGVSWRGQESCTSCTAWPQSLSLRREWKFQRESS